MYRPSLLCVYDMQVSFLPISNIGLTSSDLIPRN
jgi:hypothetical protein